MICLLNINGLIFLFTINCRIKKKKNTQRFHIGMVVCLLATPFAHLSKKLEHPPLALRHTKQNLVLHRLHTTFLHLALLCSTRMPQLGQARMEGQSETPLTLSKTMFEQFARMSSGPWQSSLSQRSERGYLPFHSFRHCQQNA